MLLTLERNAIGGAINIITSSDYKNNFNFSSKNKENYDFLANQNFINKNNSILNIKVGGVKHKTISSSFGGKEEDGVDNLSANINSEIWLRERSKNFKFYLFERLKSRV